MNRRMFGNNKGNKGNKVNNWEKDSQGNFVPNWRTMPSVPIPEECQAGCPNTSTEPKGFDNLREAILKDFPEVKEMIEQLTVVKSLIKGMERGSLTPAAVSEELSRLLKDLEGKIEEDKPSEDVAEPEVETVKVTVIGGPKKVKEEELIKVVLEARNNTTQHKELSEDLHKLTGELGAKVSTYLEDRERSTLLDVTVATEGAIQDFIMEQAIGLIATTYVAKDIEAMLGEVLSSAAEPGKPITISELNAISYKILAGIDPVLLDTARYTKKAVMQIYRKDLAKLTDGVVQEVALSIVASMLTSISVSIMSTYAQKAFKDVVREKQRAAAKSKISSNPTGKSSPIAAVSKLAGILIREVDEAFEAFKAKSSGKNSIN